MFSPMVATASVTESATDLPVDGRVSAASLAMSPSAESATEAAPLTRAWKPSLRATKSVSEFSSTTAPRVPSVATPIRPSAAVRPDFLAALERPFLRSQSTAASMSPPFSVSAALQSIMPAPVFSRRSFTWEAEMVVMFASESASD